ncbi:MAG: metallophosphoesterase [Velocimicrobium sp.]
MEECRLDRKMKKIYRNAERIEVGETTKIAIMSDCHRGTGEWNDNFAENEKIYFTALREYYRNDYTYIELGDGDELWENRDYSKIIQLYSHIFWLLSQFYREGRLYMLYGNHDKQKKSKKFTKKYMSEYYYEAENRYLPLFPKIEVTEGLVLKLTCCEKQRTILLVHGHQGDLLNDTLWRFTRWMVRYIWKPLELLGINNPMTPAGNYSNRPKHANKVEQWAECTKQITIGGHTHHALCSSDLAACYFNTGSCVHPRCIMAIEIEDRQLRLVKWGIDVDSRNHLLVKKELLVQHYLD